MHSIPLLETGHNVLFPPLPNEIFLCVLDELVKSRNGQQPIAHKPNGPITKALRALTLTSRRIYPVASQYLYARCLFLGDYISFSCFRRTFGLPLGYNHPVSLDYGEAGRNQTLFESAHIPQHFSSLFISPARRDEQHTPLLRLPEVIDLCEVVGSNLKRLVLDLLPVYSVSSELRSLNIQKRLFSSMVVLEELVVSYDVMDFFPAVPPKVCRLAVTTQGIDDALLDWALSMPLLETFMILRSPDMNRDDVEKIFAQCPTPRAKPLDVVLGDVSSSHCTPEGTREWKDEDIVRFWEIDVPTICYGDESDLVICDAWIWEQAVAGTLFKKEKRRMLSWPEAKARLVALHLLQA
ncbi:hypothetical protein B0J11DRAFT_554741 [Dendryphion nanum]|uniref:F-box domain-containing protein n=1 Tax=Dendryphion nanum TaxID=256645 RepID=A0A9P9CZ29_9PLEO|nr:hypothetical protein B0J11DRAFT_554741 [Dendryphion nanum]